jgi:hypothetical protein
MSWQDDWDHVMGKDVAGDPVTMGQIYADLWASRPDRRYIWVDQDQYILKETGVKPFIGYQAIVTSPVEGYRSYGVGDIYKQDGRVMGVVEEVKNGMAKVLIRGDAVAWVK